MSNFILVQVEAILPNEVASGTMWDVVFTPFASKAMCDVSTHGVSREDAAWNAVLGLMQGNLKYSQSRGEGPSAHSEVTGEKRSRNHLQGEEKKKKN